MSDGQIIAWCLALGLAFALGMFLMGELISNSDSWTRTKNAPKVGVQISGVSCDDGWRLKAIEIKHGTVTNVVCVPRA